MLVNPADRGLVDPNPHQHDSAEGLCGALRPAEVAVAWSRNHGGAAGVQGELDAVLVGGLEHQLSDVGGSVGAVGDGEGAHHVAVDGDCRRFG